VLPEAIRLVELRARVPRYQREMLRYLALQHGTTVDELLTRELEDVACAHSRNWQRRYVGSLSRDDRSPKAFGRRLE
jgi:hypothetical protein